MTQKNLYERDWNPFVSVIMPAFNAENVISRSIESIQLQTYKNFELLIIDDGSTDCTSQIIATYANRDNRIKNVRKNNGGASNARNEGLNIAKGQFITFCDADDFVYENWLDEMIKNSINADIVITGFFKDNDGIITKHGFNYKGSIKGIYDIYPNLTMIGALWNKLFIRDIIHKNCIRFNTCLSFREDEEFLFRYLRFCKNINIIDTPTYHYYEPDWDKYNDRIASLTGFDTVCSIFESLKILDIQGFLYNLNYNDLRARYLYNCKHNPIKSINYLKKYLKLSDKTLISEFFDIGCQIKRSIIRRLKRKYDSDSICL